MDLMKHLKENNISYRKHWWLAMSCSITLFVHAWLPFLFEHYASDKICNKNK